MLAAGIDLHIYISNFFSFSQREFEIAGDKGFATTGCPGAVLFSTWAYVCCLLCVLSSSVEGGCAGKICIFREFSVFTLQKAVYIRYMVTMCLKLCAF